MSLSRRGLGSVTAAQRVRAEPARVSIIEPRAAVTGQRARGDFVMVNPDFMHGLAPPRHWSDPVALPNSCTDVVFVCGGIDAGAND